MNAQFTLSATLANALIQKKNMQKRMHILVPWRVEFGLGRAHFGLGVLNLALAVQRSPRHLGKKKKVARNFLKICMEVYNLILSTSGKDLEKIPTNEVFMRWCVGVGKPRAHFGIGRATLASEKKKKKLLRIFSNFAWRFITLF